MSFIVLVQNKRAQCEKTALDQRFNFFKWIKKFELSFKPNQGRCTKVLFHTSQLIHVIRQSCKIFFLITFAEHHLSNELVGCTSKHFVQRLNKLLYLNMHCSLFCLRGHLKMSFYYPISHGRAGGSILLVQYSMIILFKKWANPGHFFVYIRSFQTNIITIFTSNKCEKCPSNIQCRDSNPRPLEHEPLPINTRPGLPPYDHA